MNAHATVLLFPALLVAASCTPSRDVLIGTVVDETGTPIPGAIVRVQHPIVKPSPTGRGGSF